MQIDYDWLNNPDNHYLNEATFWEMVAQCAYCKYEKRNFADGHALEDWLEAEKEVGKRCFYWFQSY